MEIVKKSKFPYDFNAFKMENSKLSTNKCSSLRYRKNFF